MDIEEKVKLTKSIHDIWPHLNERQRRLFAATQAVNLGHGGITLVSSIWGLSRVTITAGIKELKDEAPVLENKIRNIGSERPTLISIDPTIEEDLQILLEGSTRGNPERLLYWTLKSTRNLFDALETLGHQISHVQVARMLHSLGYSLQSNKKIEEGTQHIDRNKLFFFIESTCKHALNKEQPVISIDAKKKEIIGNFKNQGQQWHMSGDSPIVKVHDFPDPLVPKAIPYEIYDIKYNRVFINI
jgi:transposase